MVAVSDQICYVGILFGDRSQMGTEIHARPVSTDEVGETNGKGADLGSPVFTHVTTSRGLFTGCRLCRRAPGEDYQPSMETNGNY